MSQAYSYYAENKIDDAVLRGQALGAPTDLYLGLIIATLGKWATSIGTPSVGDSVMPSTPNGHIYFATAVTGAVGATEPTWPTTEGGTVTDGGVTWTEGVPTCKNFAFTEASGGGYGRIDIPSSLTNWSGTQGQGTTAVSSGTSGTSYLNVKEAFSQLTAGIGWVFGFFLADAGTAGNLWIWSPLTTPQLVDSGAQPEFDANSISVGLQ